MKHIAQMGTEYHEKGWRDGLEERCCNFALKRSPRPPGGSSDDSAGNARLLLSSSFLRPSPLSLEVINSLFLTPSPCTTIYRGSHTFALAFRSSPAGQGWPLLVWPERGQIDPLTPLRISDSVNPPESLTYVTGFPLIRQTYKLRGDRRACTRFRYREQQLKRNAKGNSRKLCFPFSRGGTVREKRNIRGHISAAILDARNI